MTWMRGKPPTTTSAAPLIFAIPNVTFRLASDLADRRLARRSPREAGPGCVPPDQPGRDMPDTRHALSALATSCGPARHQESAPTGNERSALSATGQNSATTCRAESLGCRIAGPHRSRYVIGPGLGLGAQCRRYERRSCRRSGRSCRARSGRSGCHPDRVPAWSYAHRTRNRGGRGPDDLDLPPGNLHAGGCLAAHAGRHGGDVRGAKRVRQWGLVLAGPEGDEFSVLEDPSW